MRKTVYKYPLQIKPAFQLLTPIYFKPLHVAMHNRIPYVWAEVNEGGNDKDISRTFYCVSTGNGVPLGATHLGTVFKEFNTLVWHFYWHPNRSAD